jgi:hypothetical protein
MNSRKKIIFKSYNITRSYNRVSQQMQPIGVQSFLLSPIQMKGKQHASMYSSGIPVVWHQSESISQQLKGDIVSRHRKGAIM